MSAAPNQRMKLSARGGRSIGNGSIPVCGRRRPQLMRVSLGAASPGVLALMNTAELARLQDHYRRLTDAKIAELYAQGPAAFASNEVWTALESEFKGRSVSLPPLGDSPPTPPVREARRIWGLPVFIFVLLVSPFVLLAIYFLYLVVFWRAG